MLRQISAAYLVTTALTLAPALAQSNNSRGMNNSAQEFVTKAAEGGMFEVQSSQLALKKSPDKDVKDFAQKMIDDHTKADDKLKSLAKGETVPTSLDHAHQQMLTKLQSESGSNFAEQFKQMQVSAHQQAVELFQNYADHGSDASLKQFASQTLPTLKDHLQMAQSITIASNATGSQTVGHNGAAVEQSGGREFMTQQAQGTWRMSKMVGLGVYNEQNQRVGDINDVLFDRDGKVDAVVIGVGGFLGLGERNVAVAYDQLKWSMTPTSETASNDVGNNPGGTGTAAPGLGSPASPVNPAPMGDATRVSDQQPAAYPDHAVLPNASKDQLQKAPQFTYGVAPR